MKVKAYMRIAKHVGGRKGYAINATRNPSYRPLEGTRGDVLPTVMFAVEFDIPDKAFKQAEQVIAEITIPESALEIAADVDIVEED